MSVLEILLVILMPAAIAIVAMVADRAFKQRRMLAEARRRAEEWKAANPPLAPLTDVQVEDFRRWYEAQALPAATLSIRGRAEPGATGSHIGGAVMWPSSKPWPQGRDGRPLQFLAQIDFAMLPALPDFPERGVVQFFIGEDDGFGCDFDNPVEGSFRVEWWPEGVIDGTITASPQAGEDFLPISNDLREQAHVLEAAPAMIYPSPYTMPVERHPDKVLRRENAKVIEDLCLAHGVGDVHRVGGHPEFTQADFREDTRFEGYDRLLLQLWSDPVQGLMWGDMGQGNFMITRKDLLARDFSKVTFHWDCC